MRSMNVSARARTSGSVETSPPWPTVTRRSPTDFAALSTSERMIPIPSTNWANVISLVTSAFLNDSGENPEHN